MQYEKLKNYERYWRANQSIEQRIMSMKSAETSVTPQAGDGSQHMGAHDPMQSVDKRIDYCASHSEEYAQNLAVMHEVDKVHCFTERPVRTRNSAAQIHRFQIWAADVLASSKGCALWENACKQNNRVQAA